MNPSSCAELASKYLLGSLNNRAVLTLVVERADPESAQDREAVLRMIEETKKELREILRLL